MEEVAASSHQRSLSVSSHNCSVPAGIDDFHHEPLDVDEGKIRVLSILPGSSESTIRCELQQIDLTSSYTCLSYTWGSNKQSRLILVNGKQFPIRQNLYAFLTTARRQGIFWKLWIDAICIDQQNIEERNHQVQQMADIFRRAQQVLIYAGHVPQSTATLLRRVDQAFGARIVPSLAVLCAMLARPQGMIMLSDLFALPYWERQWIVQEVILAREPLLLLENSTTSWSGVEVLLRYLDSFGLSKLIGSQPARYLAAWRRIYATGKHDVSVQQLMSAFASHQCSDIRDKVYSILGILPEFQTGGISIRYDEDVSALMLRVAVELGPATLDILLERLGSLSRALKTRWAFICVQCFWQLPQQVQAKIWPGEDRSKIARSSQLLVVSFDDLITFLRKELHVPLDQNPPGKLYTVCRRCYRQFDGSSLWSVTDKCSSAVCLEIQSAER